MSSVLLMLHWTDFDGDRDVYSHLLLFYLNYFDFEFLFIVLK